MPWATKHGWPGSLPPNSSMMHAPRRYARDVGQVMTSLDIPNTVKITKQLFVERCVSGQGFTRPRSRRRALHRPLHALEAPHAH